MGMDTVELVIRFEDAFGIAIPNEVAAELTTPRKVTDYILTQVALSNQPSCLSQQAFYFLREKLAPSLNFSRKDFRPGTRLESLVPLENRRAVWAGMKSQIGPAALPDLVRPMWLFSLLCLITVLSSLYALIYAWSEINVRGASVFLCALFVGVVIGSLGAVVTRPTKRHFRRDSESASELAKYLTVHSPNIFKKVKSGWTRRQVAAVVREVIIDQVGEKDFGEDSHFVHDMHLD